MSAINDSAGAPSSSGTGARVTARKAIGAAIGAGAAALGAAMLDGQLTIAELTVAGGSALITGATVWKLAYSVPAD